MKAFWTGSDALFLVMYPPSKKRKYIYMFFLRVYARITDFFVQCHLINHEGLRPALEKFGMKKPIEVREDSYPTTIYPKKNHPYFTVLFYLPKTNNQKYADWIYGKVFLDYLELHHNVFVIDGSFDMSIVYPIVDCYVKVNRTKYNALNRIGKECLLNKIPVKQLHWYRSDSENLAELKKWINTKKDIWLTKREKGLLY